MAVHFPIGIQAYPEGSQTAGGKGRIIGNEKMIRLSIQIHPHRSPQQLDLSSLRADGWGYPKSPGINSIGAPWGVRSAAWSQASR